LALQKTARFTASRLRNGFACFALGGPIAGVRDGDVIHFDVVKQVLEVEISGDVLRQRMSEWKAPQPRYPTGVFAKYAALVSSASQGAITRPPK